MAGMKSIDEARAGMEDGLLDLTMTMLAFKEVLAACGDDQAGPAWLFVLSSKVDSVQHQVEAYMEAVHKHARPVLSDMDRLTR